MKFKKDKRRLTIFIKNFKIKAKKFKKLEKPESNYQQSLEVMDFIVEIENTDKSHEFSLFYNFKYMQNYILLKDKKLFPTISYMDFQNFHFLLVESTYSRFQVMKLELNVHSFLTLGLNKWYNDEIINRYIKLLEESVQYSDSIILNSFFFTKLQRDYAPNTTYKAFLKIIIKKVRRNKLFNFSLRKDMVASI
jgi:Ulp1 family protease